MLPEYTFKELEITIQKEWEKGKIFEASEDASKKKILCALYVSIPERQASYGTCT